jgi:2-methylcitrate dehydratase PrpD
VVDRPPPFCSPLSALASAQFTLAVAALRGHCTPWDFATDTLTDPAVVALARNVTVVPDLDAEGDPTGWGARVEVTTASGTVLVERESAKGDPGNELTRAELTEKFETLAGRSLGRAPAHELAGTLLSSGGEAPTAALGRYVLPLLCGHPVGLGGGR